jgi:hypothetical protein
MKIDLYQTKKKIAFISPVPWLNSLDARSFGALGSPINPEESAKANKGGRHQVAIEIESLPNGNYMAFDAGEDIKTPVGRQRYLAIHDGQIQEIWADYFAFRAAKQRQELSGLPMLKGTEAQIKYADGVRAECLLQIMGGNDHKLEFPCDDAKDLRFITSAKWWIENQSEIVARSLEILSLSQRKIDRRVIATLPPISSPLPGVGAYAEEIRLRELRNFKSSDKAGVLAEIIAYCTVQALQGLREASWWMDRKELGRAAAEIHNLRIAIFRELTVEVDDWKVLPNGEYQIPDLKLEQAIAFARSPDKNYHIWYQELGF